MALVRVQKESAEGFETEANANVDGVAAVGFYPQAASGGFDANVGIERDNSDLLVLKDVGRTVTLSQFALRAQVPTALAAGTQTGSTGTFVFANGNGITFGMSGSSQITASYTVPSLAGLLSAVNISAGTTSNNLSALTFNNANGVSFGLNGSVLTGSVAAQSVQTQNVVVPSAGTQTATSGTVVFSASNGVSFGMSGSSRITASFAWNLSAGTTSNNLAAVTFANGNGVSFGLNGSQVTASIATSLTAVNLSAGTTSNNLSAFTLANGGGVSFGLNGSVVTATVATSLTAVNVSAGTTSNNLSALTFNNANGVSFGLNGSVVTGSIAAGATATGNFGALAAGTQTATSGTVVFAASNGITFGMSGSSQITASYTVPSVAGLLSAVNVSAGTTSNNLSALTFANGNGVSFGLNGSVLTASVSQTNQTMGGYALGNTTAQSSSTTFDARSLSFSGLGIASVGYSAGAVVISVPSGGGGITAINVSAGTTSNNLTALTFSNANGVSFGLNGSVVTASAAGGGGPTSLYALGNTTQNSSTTLNSLSFNALGAMTWGYSNGSIQVSAPATSSLVATGQVSIATNGSTISIGAPAQFTKSKFNPFMEAVAVAGQHGQASWHFHPIPDPANWQMDRALFDINWTNNSASTGSATLSMWAGIYTRNGSTLSRLDSASVTFALTFSGTVGNQSLQAGGRLLSMGWTGTFPENDYWMGIASRTTSGGANGSFSQYMVSDINSNFSGLMGVASNATIQDVLGLGYYSASSTAVPASVAFSQIQGTASLALRPPLYRFLYQTA